MISIVTAGSRPQNFEIIYENILEIFGEEDFYWYLICDPKKVTEEDIEKFYNKDRVIAAINNYNGGFGGILRRLATSLIDDGWIYYLDDDNLIHHNLLWLYKHVDDFPDKYAFVFKQLEKNGKFYQIAEMPSKQGHIDTGNVLIHKKAIFDNWDSTGIWAEDYRFYYSNYTIKPEYWKAIDITAAYYNYLRED